MKEFFTSDLHFGHGNIIKYCERPFRDAEHMNERLIAEINMRCKPSDTLYHVGDFCCYGKANGVEGMRNHAKFYEDQINCKVVHIMGNHDKNNKVKNSVYGMMLRLSHFNVWVQHIPPMDSRFVMPESDNIDAYICGHVHEKWKFNSYAFKPVINVGCDVWNFRPIRKDEMIAMIRKYKEEIK